MPKKILIITKDIAEFLIYSPLTKLLRAKGHTVVVIAEGLSLQKWTDAGELVYGGQPSTPMENGCRFDIDAVKALRGRAPDLVLTGLGAPINLGQSFGIAANQLGIKLGYVVDVWGAESRSKAIPDFVCVQDPFGGSTSKKHFAGIGVPKIHVTGSPALDRLKDLPWTGPQELLDSLSEKRVILLAGQDESTTPALIGLIDALETFGQPYVLIPRFHPKFLQREDLGKLWNAELAKVSHGEVIRVDPKISIAELMTYVASTTVSIYSNALIEAAVLGSLPVSWSSEIGRQKMAENCGGLTRFPLVTDGCAIEVSSAEEFIKMVLDPETSHVRHGIEKRNTEVFPNDGRNGERVLAAIEAELA